MTMRLNKLVAKRKLLAAAGALSILAAVAVPAWAGFAQGNQVTMGGQPVFAIAGSADGFSPDHRAWLAQDALDAALVLSPDKSPSAVTVNRENGAMVIMLGGRRVATADTNSAQLEGLSVHALANKWADAIKSFLSNDTNTMAYVQDLTGKNPINATVAIAERRIFMPPGTTLPVALANQINSETLIAGQPIAGTLVQDVSFGNYVLPRTSTISGVVEETAPGNFGISMTSLKTPTGTVVPIQGVLGGAVVASGAAHLVATLNMPYGDYPRYQGVSETDARVPAQIGIGTLSGNERLVLLKGSNVSYAPGQTMQVMFTAPQQVAVVLRGTQM
jgi:hypothetical protein